MMWTIWGILVSGLINHVFTYSSLDLAPTSGTPLAPSCIMEKLAPDFHCTQWKNCLSVCLQGRIAGMNSQFCKLRESIRHSHYLLLWVIDAKYHQNDVNIILLCSSLLASACVTSAVTGCCISQPLFPLSSRVLFNSASAHGYSHFFHWSTALTFSSHSNAWHWTLMQSWALLGISR